MDASSYARVFEVAARRAKTMDYHEMNTLMCIVECPQAAKDAFEIEMEARDREWAEKMEAEGIR